MLTNQWAGVALALEEHRDALRLDDINRYATSFCTNLHKWGLVAFDCCETQDFPLALAQYPLMDRSSLLRP